MNTLSLNDGLPVELQTRLNGIILSLPTFWERKPHAHFTSHGLDTSKWIRNQKLAQLAHELPRDKQLSPEEIFILSAAAYLYDIGMQSPKLRPVLDFDYRPIEALSISQLAEIRKHKHLLSYDLIQASLQTPQYGLSLNLRYEDSDYVQCIAEICRGCSDEPLESIRETFPLRGMSVRLRLLVALLRLADQLYIDRSRVNLALLEVHKDVMTPREFARWWGNIYAQTLPISNGQIPFHYFLPATQKEYISHIRALVESEFVLENNPTIQYLWDTYGLHLIPQQSPTVHYDQPNAFYPSMNSDLLNFLRNDVIVAERFIEKSEHDTTLANKSKVCILIVDYENFVLQMGHSGHFLTIDDIRSHMITLRAEASRLGIDFTAYAVGHWRRPDLRKVGEMLYDTVYELEELAEGEESSKRIESLIQQFSSNIESTIQFIIVAPEATLARPLHSLANRKVILTTWISRLPSVEVFRTVGQHRQYISEVLQLSMLSEKKVETNDLDNIASILHLENVLLTNDPLLSPATILNSLDTVPAFNGRTLWWRQFLISQKVLEIDKSNPDFFQLVSSHPQVINARTVRDEIIRVLKAVSSSETGIRHIDLINELLKRQIISTTKYGTDFLLLLKEVGIVIRDARADIEDQHIWYLNGNHPAVIALYVESYMPRLLLGLDFTLVREKFPVLHEHTLTRHLQRYLNDATLQPTYKVAVANGSVIREKTIHGSNKSQDNAFHIIINEEDKYAASILRNRDIILNILYHRSARSGITLEELYRRLSSIRSFSLTRSELIEWLRLFGQESIVTGISSDSVSPSSLIRLDLSHDLTQRLLARIHVYAFIRNMRLLKATHLEQARPVQLILTQLAKYITNNDSQLATWLIEYAEGIRLTNRIDDKLYLNQHSLVRKLDSKERDICNLLVNNIDKLSKRYSDKWVPRHIILQDMEQNIRFGYARSLHEYWLEQAIHRLKRLIQKREQQKTSVQMFIKVA